MAWNLTLNETQVRLEEAGEGAFWSGSPAEDDDEETIEESAVSVFAPYDHGVRDRQVFKSAGWRFVHPESFEDDVSEAAAPPRRTEALRPVFITDRGDVLVGTDVATVQLKADDEMPRAVAARVLAQDGLTILHQLSSLPNLYAVRLPSGRP